MAGSFRFTPADAEVWRLAGPMIISNLSTPLLGLVDTAVVGHLESPHYLGAVAVGSLIFSFLYWGFGFLRMGTTGLTAQALGVGDGDEVRAILGRAMLLALVIAILLLAGNTLFATLAFYWIDADTAVENLARHYFGIRIYSAPATLANYAVLGWFIGMHNTRAPLFILVVANSCNIILDIALVAGLKLGVGGVALASVIAEYLALVLGLLLVRYQLRRAKGRWSISRLLARERFGPMIALNGNIFIRTLCLIFAFAFFTAQGARQGEVILAANAVLLNFQTLMAYALDGFAHAAEAMTGRALGSRDPAAFRQAVHSAGFWSLLAATGFGAGYGLWGEHLVFLLTDLETVRNTALNYLPWLTAAPLISVWSFLFDGIFIGATRSREMRDTMLAALLVFFLPAWYLLQPWGNHGLWLAFLVFMAARGLTMAWIYRRGDLLPDPGTNKTGH